MSEFENEAADTPEEKEEIIEETSTTVRRKSAPDLVIDANSADIVSYTQEETSTKESVSDKARQTGQSIKELAKSIGDATKTKVKETSDKIVENRDSIRPGYVAERKDAQDISRLGVLTEELARSFENTMTAIQAHDYDDQSKMLLGYRKLLEEQINLIDSRSRMAKRLKSA